MIKRNYKPKAKNETALKKYIEDATKKGNDRHNRDTNCKRNSSECNNVR